MPKVPKKKKKKKKKMGNKVYFLPAGKHKSFLQVDSITLCVCVCVCVCVFV